MTYQDRVNVLQVMGNAHKRPHRQPILIGTCSHVTFSSHSLAHSRFPLCTCCSTRSCPLLRVGSTTGSTATVMIDLIRVPRQRLVRCVASLAAWAWQALLHPSSRWSSFCRHLFPSPGNVLYLSSWPRCTLKRCTRLTSETLPLHL